MSVNEGMTHQLREAAERWLKLDGRKFKMTFDPESDLPEFDERRRLACLLATYAAEQLAGDGGGKAATIDKAKELHKGPPPNPPKGASQIYG